MDAQSSTPGLFPGDSSHDSGSTLPLSQMPSLVPPSRLGTTKFQDNVAMQQRVKALGFIMTSMEAVKVRGMVEGPLLARMMQALLDEAESDGLEPALRHKYWATAMDAMCRMNELQAKVAADMLDLETKRREARIRMKLVRAKSGFKGDIRTSAQVIASKDLMAEVANQARGGGQ